MISSSKIQVNLLQISLEEAVRTLTAIASSAGSALVDRASCAAAAQTALDKLKALQEEACATAPQKKTTPSGHTSITAHQARKLPQLTNRLVTCYSDGGCKGNPGPAGIGAVVVDGESNEVLRAVRGFIGTATNQVAEISAATEALRQTAPGTSVLLISDSQYVLKGISEWRKGWQARGWRTSKNEPVLNLPQWLELYALVDERNVNTCWVKGHSGDVFNEMCDKLAGAAIKEALEI